MMHKTLSAEQLCVRYRMTLEAIAMISLNHNYGDVSAVAKAALLTPINHSEKDGRNDQ